MLNNYRKTTDYNDLPQAGTYIILTKSKSFLAKAIQGFMRLFQWTSGSRNTKVIPNHADGLFNGYAIGALKFGVDGNDIPSHYKKNIDPVYYIIKPLMTPDEDNVFGLFMRIQQKEKYKYIDLLWYAILSWWHKWFGKPEKLDRKKWTCYSLVASGLNYAWGKEVFPHPYRITPYEFCKIVEDNYKVLFI